MTKPIKTILIIDDEVSIRQSFFDFLEDRNFKVLTAENGRIGLEIIERMQPDIVLVDLRMPELDGLEVLKRSREFAPDIPKIVISGANRIDDVVRALRYGAWDYLVKPVKDLSILEHTVQKALEKAQLLQENHTYQEHLKELVHEQTRDLKQTFEALQKSEKQYRTLFEKTNDAIFIVEKETGCYLDANEAATELTGRTIGDLKQLTINDVIPEDADKRLMTIEKSDGTCEIGNVAFHKPDSSYRIARLSTVLLSANSVIDIARDITHDLEVETQLRQAQKMEAIGTLAGGIAHDFNNILSGIFGYSQLIEMDPENPEKVKKHISQVIKGSKRATDLVQQILTFSRQTKHKKNLLKLFLIVKEATKFLRSSIPATIEIQEKISSHATIMADPTQAHQVVMNLCTNAYHSMRDSGGTLTVELVDVELTPQDMLLDSSCVPGNYVKLEVRDTGHGMDKKILEKIFDPYFTTKQPDKGTGLGLAVVNGIVKSHNGFIQPYSKVGTGSTFQVFWPAIAKEIPGDTSNKEQTDLLPGTEQIMLVDDEADILNSLQPILENQGYKVTAFENGVSALRAFSKNPDFFDLIITDMIMPQMAGDELSVKILAIRADMPIILCTGYHESFNADTAREIGISKYVSKPVTAHDLSILIREVMNKENN